MNRRDIGKRYEEMAVRYLEEQHYQILEQNYQIRTGEIDVIAKDGNCLVFLEVKYRQNDRMGDPLEAVDKCKQRKIYQTAQYYLYQRNIQDHPCRFDVIGITGTRIQHIKNAFGAW